MMKVLTIVIPSYNAAPFLRRCVERMTPAGEELDILIVDDGSTDDTPALADTLAAEHPNIVRVIHQENGGHGEGINQGIRTARGIYLKSVDADDRIDTDSLVELLALLREHVTPETWADLVINDYAYDNPGRENVSAIRYNHVFQPGVINTWESCHPFPFWKQFVIHAVCYRVAILREHGYELPKHTFYEDNMYAYQPLPWTRKILYLPRILYGYTIGQATQSVSPENIARHMDQNTNVVTQLICTWNWKQIQEQPPHLRDYMISYLAGQILTVTLVHESANNARAEELRKEMWQTINDFDPQLCRAIRHHPNALLFASSNRTLRRLGYHAGQFGRKRLGF